MTEDRDSDALNWAGDDDPTLVTDAASATASPSQQAPRKPSAGWRVVGDSQLQTSSTRRRRGGSEAAGESDEFPTQMGSVALVLHGIVAGIFLLYTIGWAISGARDLRAPADVVGAAGYGLGLWGAALAPALWFGTTLWITRGTTSVKPRLLSFIAGIVVLAPWPFIVAGQS